jgi:hypothetical protein
MNMSCFDSAPVGAPTQLRLTFIKEVERYGEYLETAPSFKPFPSAHIPKALVGLLALRL